MLKEDKCSWMTTTEDGGQNILRSSSMGYRPFLYHPSYMWNTTTNNNHQEQQQPYHYP